MIQMKLSDGGRVVIPVEIRQALGLSEGDMVLFDLVDGEARITTLAAQRRHAKALVRKFVPRGVSLVDELALERGAEFGDSTDGN